MLRRMRTLLGLGRSAASDELAGAEGPRRSFAGWPSDRRPSTIPAPDARRGRGCLCECSRHKEKWVMRTRVMALMLGALLAGTLEVGWARSVLAGTESRHAGQVVKVYLQTRIRILSELAEGGAPRTLHLRLSPGATIVRSEPLPADQITDLERPFKDTPIDLSAVRPGEFVVVELSGTGKTGEVSSVMVTFEPGTIPGQASQTAAQ